ncbi:MAG: Sec-independent protein translocase protein TatB [Stenotrophomonas sp.]
MFDIGFSELLVIGVVALVVLGPERLPKAARFAGLWVRRARNQWDSVKQELERELHTEELKRNFHEVRDSVQQAESGLRDGSQQLQRDAEQLRRQVQQHGDMPGTEASASDRAHADDSGGQRVISLENPPAPAAGTPTPLQPDAIDAPAASPSEAHDEYR